MDSLENEVVQAVNALVPVLLSEKASDRRWTNALLAAFQMIGKRHGWNVYPDRGPPLRQAWVYDLTFAEEPDGVLESLPLVAEIEWKRSAAELAWDFQKLLARAEHRLFICDLTQMRREPLLNTLLEHTRRFKASQSDDRYLFGIWDEREGKFCWYQAIGREFVLVPVP